MSSKSVPELELWLSSWRKCSRSHGLWDRWPLGSDFGGYLYGILTMSRLSTKTSLKVDLNQYIAEFKNPDLPIKVVINLPYYITTPILMHLIESKIPFKNLWSWCKRGGRPYLGWAQHQGLWFLSIAVQYYMTAKVAFIVPRNRLCASTKRRLCHFEDGPSRRTSSSSQGWRFLLLCQQG